MIQGGEQLCFALETGQPLRIAGEVLGQHLDRDITIERYIACSVNLAHTAGAEPFGDLVGA